MRTLTIPRGIFNAVCYTADGEYLVGLHSGWRLRVWATADFRERYAAALPGFALRHTSLRLAGDDAVLSRGVYSLAELWAELRETPGRVSGDLVRVVPWDSVQHTLQMALTPDGKTVWEWRWQNRQQGSRLRRMNTRGQSAEAYDLSIYAGHVAAHPDGRHLALASNHVVALYDLQKREIVAQLRHTNVAEHTLFSPDGRSLVVAAGRSLWLWDVTSRDGRRYPAFDRHVDALAFSPDGERLAAADRTGEIRLLEVSDGREVGRLDFGVGAIHDLAYSPDGTTVAGAGHENAVVVWDLE